MGLELPDGIDGDWDALTDRLTDLSWWGEARGYLILASGWESFARAAAEDAGTAAGSPHGRRRLLVRQTDAAGRGARLTDAAPARDLRAQNQLRLPPTSDSHWFR